MTISPPAYLLWGKTSLTRTVGSVDSSTEMEETTFPSPPLPPMTLACRRDGSFKRSDTVTLIDLPPSFRVFPRRWPPNGGSLPPF